MGGLLHKIKHKAKKATNKPPHIPHVSLPKVSIPQVHIPHIAPIPQVHIPKAIKKIPSTFKDIPLPTLSDLPMPKSLLDLGGGKSHNSFVKQTSIASSSDDDVLMGSETGNTMQIIAIVGVVGVLGFLFI